MAPYAASLVASEATATRSGVPRTIFICFQSYGISLPQSRHTTYVPVGKAARLRAPFFIVMGKLMRPCVQPNSTSRIRENIPLPPQKAVSELGLRCPASTYLRVRIGEKGSTARVGYVALGGC